jgi:hypothetical protein
MKAADAVQERAYAACERRLSAVTNAQYAHGRCAHDRVQAAAVHASQNVDAVVQRMKPAHVDVVYTGTQTAGFYTDDPNSLTDNTILRT